MLFIQFVVNYKIPDLVGDGGIDIRLGFDLNFSSGPGDIPYAHKYIFHSV